MALPHREKRPRPSRDDKVELREDGLVRIALKRAYSDGTVAVDMEPLSLLCRLAASVPPARYQIVKYAGVLAAASPLRKRIAPQSPEATADAVPRPKRSGTYRPWAELLRRMFGVDVLDCSKCHGRMRLVAMVTDPNSVTRFLKSVGEHAAVPERAPNRGPPYWASTVLRQGSIGEAA